MKTLIVSLLLISSLVCVAPTFASTASIYYSDGPWSGKVINTETKQPIEGAVVLAVWQKVYATPAGDNSYFLDAVEVLTDRDGKFTIPKFKAFNIIPIIRRIEGPDFTIFKPGYTSFPGPAFNYFHKYFPNSPLRVDREALEELFKKGVVIEMLRLKTREQRLDALPHISDPFINHNEKKTNYIKLMNLERKELGLDPETGETGGRR